MSWSAPRVPAPCAAAALVVLMLGGCAGLATSDAAGRDMAGPAPTLTGICPVIEGEPAPTDCVPYDVDAAMRQNDAYRQRRALTDEQRDSLEPRRQVAQEALAGVPAADLGTVTVTRSLQDAGFEERQIFADENHIDDLTVVTVIISVPGGCLVGSASDGGAEVDATGQIADGGCVTAPGH